MIAPPGWRAVMIGRLGIAGVSVALYAAALALPALHFHKSTGEDSIFAGWEFHTLKLMGVTFDADEGGVKKMVLARLDVGFVLWMTAISAIVPGALLLKDPPPLPREGGPFVRG